MARGLQQGIGSITVLIVFVGLWLVSTVLLVLLYTNQEELRVETARLQEDNERLISRAERSSVQLFQSAKAGGPTVVGLLEGARSEIAELATGESSDDAVTVRNKLDETLQAIRDDRLVPNPADFEDVSYDEGLTMLYETFAAEKAKHGDAEERVAELQAEVDRLVEANTEQRSNFDRRARELGDQLAEVDQDRARYRNERDEEMARLARDFESHREQSTADLTRERQHNAALEQHQRQLQDRFTALQEKFAGLLTKPEELSTARQPDGRILTAIPGDDVVYVNLGRKHKLVRGLEFAVYSASSGIPADGRAKARIEVVSMDAESAECKINGLAPNEVILEGDLIANPIYDPDRPVTFVVAGKFDLDHDGTTDPDGAATIESMITHWGGTVSGELTALTDFMVLGQAPRRPRHVAEGSSQQAQRAQAMQQAVDRYEETVAAARTLAVPVLTQEVFLNFLGYTGRYASR